MYIPANICRHVFKSSCELQQFYGGLRIYSPGKSVKVLLKVQHLPYLEYFTKILG